MFRPRKKWREIIEVSFLPHLLFARPKHRKSMEMLATQAGTFNAKFTQITGTSLSCGCGLRERFDGENAEIL